MSYLAQHLPWRPASAGTPRASGARVDERTVLNLAGFDGGAHVRALVEDTSAQRARRRRIPSPRLKLRITDCESAIHLEFSLDSAVERRNSLHKIDTLIASLERFRAGLEAEAALRVERERRPRTRKEARCRT
jgi:hypothetical protein